MAFVARGPDGYTVCLTGPSERRRRQLMAEPTRQRRACGTAPDGRSPARRAAPMSAAWRRAPTAALHDALQRSSERGDDDAIGGATIGKRIGRHDAASRSRRQVRAGLGGRRTGAIAACAVGRGPGRRPLRRLGRRRRRRAATALPARAAPTRSHPTATRGLVRHDPDEPPNESAIESLGRSVSEVVTGPLEDDENRDATRSP